MPYAVLPRGSRVVPPLDGRPSVVATPPQARRQARYEAGTDRNQRNSRDEELQHRTLFRVSKTKGFVSVGVGHPLRPVLQIFGAKRAYDGRVALDRELFERVAPRPVVRRRVRQGAAP